MPLSGGRPGLPRGRAHWTICSLRCATCGRALTGDPDENPTGDAGRPICGECARENDFLVMDIADGVLDGDWDSDEEDMTLERELAERLAGAVWGHLVGDAVGVPYEFGPARPAASVVFGATGTHRQPPGTWSDDGALMLALLDSMLAVGFDIDDQGRSRDRLVSRRRLHARRRRILRHRRHDRRRPPGDRTRNARGRRRADG